MPDLQLLFPEIAACDAVNVCHPPVCAGAPASLLAEVGGEGGTEPENIDDVFLVPDELAREFRERHAAARRGRKAKHASAAARKAAYRADKARVDFTDKPEIIAKLRETAAMLDCSVNELLQSMVRFAQCNRNWKHVGLYGARRDGVLQ
ncbi:hypothetical protein [Diaphorobacter sp. ED-3]|uniref:hypothetical protein n=1 Tax=Diaphorobacter sp. ED-3 TaxID=3016636 RepID=UPI0022DCF57A|nr:hypothetical protein [Diaphorobacter sp. ED-3]